MSFKVFLKLFCLSMVSSLALSCILRGLGVDFGLMPFFILGVVIGIFTPTDED